MQDIFFYKIKTKCVLGIFQASANIRAIEAQIHDIRVEKSVSILCHNQLNFNFQSVLKRAHKDDKEGRKQTFYCGLTKLRE